jgi:hypothetical protein
LEPEDVEMEGVPGAIWSELNSEAARFVVHCPGCQHASRVPTKYLGQRVACKRCQQSFSADWAEVTT